MKGLERRRGMTMGIAAAVLAGAACSGSDAVIFTNSMLAANAALRPPFMRAVDGIPGWKRIGEPERYTKAGLYGYIDGGAEIVLQYGFLELSVFTFKPSADPVTSTKEVVLEVYGMASGPAAFGLYSTKLEGGEAGRPGIKADHWILAGQANLVKGEYLMNILAPQCGEDEIGLFASAVDRKVPAPRTERPKGLKWLPGEGQAAGSGRYIKGASTRWCAGSGRSILPLRASAGASSSSSGRRTWLRRGAPIGRPSAPDSGASSTGSR